MFDPERIEDQVAEYSLTWINRQRLEAPSHEYNHVFVT
jgi:hypothetical protein